MTVLVPQQFRDIWLPPNYKHWTHYATYYQAGLIQYHQWLRDQHILMVPTEPDRSKPLEEVSYLHAVARVRHRLGEAMHYYAIREDQPGLRSFI